MKIIKWLVICVVIVVILIAAAIGFGISRLDAVAKAGIEQGGTYAMGVETKVDSVDIGLIAGTFDMTGLKIANPAGFKEGKFLTLDKAGVGVNNSTLRAKVIDLPKLSFSGLTVNLEKSISGANYKTILDNLKKVSTDLGSSTKTAPGQQMTFVVRELTISNVTVNAELAGLGAAGPRVTIPIHEVKLTNIGQNQGGVKGSGVTAEQLASIVVQAILNAAVENGGLPADMLGDLQGQLAQLNGLKDVGVEVVGKLGESAKQLQGSIDGVNKSIEDLGKQGQEAVDNVKKGLEGLIPGKK